MTNEVLISWADQDFVTVSGVAQASFVSTARRTNGTVFVLVASDALNDEVKYTRYFPKSGTYKVRYNHSITLDGGIIDIAIDSPAGNNLFDGINHQGANDFNVNKETTKEIARGFHDISLLAQADGGTSDFTWIMQFLQFDLIDEHPVLGESAPAKEADGMVLLGKHKAEVAESTFTFDLADVDLHNNYTQLKILFDGETTASLALQAIFNAIGGTNNFSKGFRAVGSTLTNIAPSAAAQLQLASNGLIGTNTRFNGEASFQSNEAGTVALLGESVFHDDGQDFEHIVHRVVLTVSKVTSIEIKTSTSTWKVGTKIEVYGVKK